VSVSSTDRSPLADFYETELKHIKKAYHNWVHSNDSDTVLLREALLSNWLGPPPQEPAKEGPSSADEPVSDKQPPASANSTAAASATSGADVDRDTTVAVTGTGLASDEATVVDGTSRQPKGEGVLPDCQSNTAARDQTRSPSHVRKDGGGVKTPADTSNLPIDKGTVTHAADAGATPSDSSTNGIGSSGPSTGAAESVPKEPSASVFFEKISGGDNADDAMSAAKADSSEPATTTTSGPPQQVESATTTVPVLAATSPAVTTVPVPGPRRAATRCQRARRRRGHGRGPRRAAF
jgi:hypothetical protein